jgi:hypothetical protein
MCRAGFASTVRWTYIHSCAECALSIYLLIVISVLARYPQDDIILFLHSEAIGVELEMSARQEARAERMQTRTEIKHMKKGNQNERSNAAEWQDRMDTRSNRQVCSNGNRQKRQAVPHRHWQLDARIRNQRVAG